MKNDIFVWGYHNVKIIAAGQNKEKLINPFSFLWMRAYVINIYAIVSVNREVGRYLSRLYCL